MYINHSIKLDYKAAVVEYIEWAPSDEPKNAPRRSVPFGYSSVVDDLLSRQMGEEKNKKLQQLNRYAINMLPRDGEW